MEAKKPNDVDPENIIKITREQLNDAQKELMKKAMDEYEEACVVLEFNQERRNYTENRSPKAEAHHGH
jgi:hypothetical protein